MKPFYEENQTKIEDLEIEMDRRNSAIPLKDLTNTNARIEPGAFIREQAIIEDGASYDGRNNKYWCGSW